MSNRLPFDDFHGFSAWLAQAGAEVQKLTNPWELLRVRLLDGVFVVYKNSKGRQAWPEPLLKLRQIYTAEEGPPHLAPTPAMPAGAKIVTIFADASYDHISRAAGWGAWIKRYGQDAITCGAAIKAAMTCSADAEICALANALIVAWKRGVLDGAAAVMFQSDCLDALSMIVAHVPGAIDRPAKRGLATGSPNRSPRSAQQAAIDAITRTAWEAGVQIFTRHVKGHQKGPGRQWVNNQCDLIARAAMEDQRRVLTQQGDRQ